MVINNLSDFREPLVPEVLVDADAFVGLAREGVDTNFEKAKDISLFLQEKGVHWFVSPFTIGEAATVLSYKVSQETARLFLKDVRRYEVDQYPLNDDLQEDTDRFFFHEKRKRTSYFDCFNMALLTRYKRTLVGIFSFDKIYRSRGFHLIDSLEEAQNIFAV